jgi:hypothetical protein
MSVCLCEQKVGWAKEAIHKRLKDLLPPHIKIHQENLMEAEDQLDEDLDLNIKYIHHDKEERKNLLDGTGEGLPSPPAAGSIKEGDSNKVEDPEQWLNSSIAPKKWSRMSVCVERSSICDNKDATTFILC